MRQQGIIVEGFVPVRPSALDNLRQGVWSFAMDQRAFGPGKLLVAFSDPIGRFRGLAYAARTNDPLVPFEACLDHMGQGAAAAVALCDEPVPLGPVPQDSRGRFTRARAIASEYEIHLVDWISCDDEQCRAFRLRAFKPSEQPDWWDVPTMLGNKVNTV